MCTYLCAFLCVTCMYYWILLCLYLFLRIYVDLDIYVYVYVYMCMFMYICVFAYVSGGKYVSLHNVACVCMLVKHTRVYTFTIYMHRRAFSHDIRGNHAQHTPWKYGQFWCFSTLSSFHGWTTYLIKSCTTLVWFVRFFKSRWKWKT